MVKETDVREHCCGLQAVSDEAVHLVVKALTGLFPALTLLREVADERHRSVYLLLDLVLIDLDPLFHLNQLCVLLLEFGRADL